MSHAVHNHQIMTWHNDLLPVIFSKMFLRTLRSQLFQPRPTGKKSLSTRRAGSPVTRASASPLTRKRSPNKSSTANRCTLDCYY